MKRSCLYFQGQHICIHTYVLVSERTFFIAQRAMHKTRAQLFPTINFTFHVKSLVFGPHRLPISMPAADEDLLWAKKKTSTQNETNSGNRQWQPAAREICADDFPLISTIFFIYLYLWAREIGSNALYLKDWE